VEGLSVIADWIDAYNVAYEERETLTFDGEIMFVDQGEYGPVVLNKDGAYLHSYCNFTKPE
jgi:hypothetical protein